MISGFESWIDAIKKYAKEYGVDGDALINSLSLGEWREWYDEGFTALEAYNDAMRND